MANLQNEAFLRALMPIRDYLTDLNVVISGGWVPVIYQRYVLPGVGQPSLFTADVDVVVTEMLPLGDRPSLRQLLIQDGFREDFIGDANPPASCFRKDVGDLKVELEFLTPLTGARNNQTLKVQGDLAAQALRFSDILLEDPMPVNINEKIDGVVVNLEFFVPRPAAFVFQKCLAFSKRKEPVKKSQDLYYVFDLIAGYPEFAENIEDGMSKFKKDRPSWFNRFIKYLTEYFIFEGAPGPRMIAEQRSGAAYKNLNDAQLEQYCRSIMAAFVKKVT